MSDTKVTITFERELLDDESPDTSYLTQDYADVKDAAERAKYLEADANRLQAYKDGAWSYIGVRAVALIRIDRPGYGTFYTLKSPGLWGIESDSGEDYLQSVFKNECDTLRADIEAMCDAVFK